MSRTKGRALVIYRNVASVMLAVSVLQLAAGILSVAIPLAMDGYGWSRISIGAVLASYGGGFLIGSLIAPAVVRNIGHIRAYAAFAGVAAALTLLIALGDDFLWWCLSRAGFGLCVAGLFAVAESWIADATPADRRGAVISVYQILSRVGLIAGPFLIAIPALSLIESFVLAGAFISLALAPITATRRAQPVIAEGERISPMRLFKIAPTAAGAAFTAGVVNAGVLAFVPLWAEGLSGVETGAGAATVLAAVYGVSMIVQWPAGKLSDQFDRRYVIAGLAGFAGLFALALAIFPGLSLQTSTALAGLWGAVSLSFYGVAVAHAADRSRVEELPAIASGVLMVWAAGSIVGPLIAGALYGSALGARGLFLFAAGASLLLTALTLWRTRARRATPDAQRERFVNLQATSAALAEIEGPGERAEPETV